MTLSELRAKITPLDADHSLDETCPECGAVYRAAEYQYPKRTLGIHRATKHGVRSPKAQTPSKTKAKAATAA